MRALLLFVPSVLLAACTTGKVALDDTSGPPDAEDTGSVADGAISVSPASIDLATLFVGQSTASALTVTNIGEGAVDVTLTVTGGWATSYTLDAYTSQAEPGADTIHTLTLTPTTWGDHSVSILVDDAVSGGHVEVPVVAHVQEDTDGDGFGSAQSGGDDCDDEDAGVNPGVAEVWYDGVDADCAGDDDFDRDADGHTVDADCDDADATAYPGATDPWYDGVDADCAGNDDYDQDADGWVPAEYAGLATIRVEGSGGLPVGDCDDTDASVNPGAADAWYDGMDSDCAGNDDDDQDADGWAVDADCDDTDPTVYPGAADARYDGIDSDCLGDGDWDQDGDGVDYPTDCNDTDATITGPEAESLDGIDNDCNGVVDDFSVADIASGVLYGYASSMGIGNHGLMAMTSDLTGDGATDLVLGATGASYGYAFVVGGVSASTAAGSVADYDAATVSGDSGYYPIGWVNGPFGDTNGDGVDDLLVGGQYASGYYSSSYGRTYLLEGGADLTGSLSSSSYDARFSGDSDADDAYQGASGDLDGDGLADVAIGSAYDNYGSSYSSSVYDCGSVAIFAGADLDGGMDLGDANDRIYGTDDYDYLGYSVVMADVNDDGYLDILAGSPGYDGGADDGGGVFVFSGGSLAWDESADDAAVVEIQGDSSDLALGEDTLAHPGDIDGDGALDLGVTSEDSGDVWLFVGIGALTGELDLGDADHTISGTAGDVGSMLILDSDLDGDGADEVVVGADGDDTAASNAGAVYVYRWSGGWGTALDTSDADASLWGTQADGYFGSGGAGGRDLDADGRDDIAIGETSNDTGASNGGAVWIVLGW